MKKYSSIVRGFRVLVLALVHGVVISAPTKALARQLDAKEVSSRYLLYRVLEDVKPDGRYRALREFRIRIQNENGRESEGVQMLKYNSMSSRIKLIEAYTLTDGKKYPVRAKQIQVRDAGDSNHGFDRMKQLVVAYPRVEIGSEIYAKYETVYDDVPIPGFYSFSWSLQHWLVDRLEVELRTPKELHWRLHDPSDSFDVKQSTENGKSVLRFITKRPIYNNYVDEENSFLDAGRSPFLMASTETDWSKYAGIVIQKQENLLKQPLPRELQGVRELALKEQGAESQLNRATALIVDKVRYFGDWKRRHGGFVPRSPKEIIETRYGDCKDLSLVTVAVFRALGFNADVAWVWRGKYPVSDKAYEMPLDAEFNHAIVRVQTGDRVYWIDPTNPVSWAKITRMDISGRPAFVMNGKSPFLDRIPKRESRDYLVESDLEYEFLPSREVEVKGTVRLEEASAVDFYQGYLYSSDASTHFNLINQLASGTPVLDWSLTPINSVEKRIGRPFNANVRFRLADGGMRTTAGSGFLIPTDSVVSQLLSDMRDRVGDLYMGTPFQIVSRIGLTNVRVVGDQSIDCEIKSPWATLTRKLERKNTGLIVTDRYELHELKILLKDLTSPEYKEFQKKVRSCFYKTSLILQNR